MHQSHLAPTRRARLHAHERALLQFAVAAWIALLALGLVLLL
jgi:hypothetical protein